MWSRGLSWSHTTLYKILINLLIDYISQSKYLLKNYNIIILIQDYC